MLVDHIFVNVRFFENLLIKLYLLFNNNIIIIIIIINTIMILNMFYF